MIYPKRRITLPRDAFLEAELQIGQRLRVRADGPGRMTIDLVNENGPPQGGPFQQSLEGDVSRS